MRKQLLTYTKWFFILQLCFIVFGTISCLLPNESIKENIVHSVEMYNDEHAYPQYLIREPAHQADNFTDYLIMNMIYNTSPHKPFKYLLFPQWYYSNENSLGATIHINLGIQKKMHEPNFIYGRYWHGSSFAYRWLFITSDLSGVRWINFLICSVVIFAFVAALSRNIRKPEMYLLLIGMVFVNYYLILMSLQFTPVFLIAMIGSITLLKNNNQQKRVDVLFLILGSLTSYFDLLTAPVITLGIPLLVWVACQPAVVDWFQKFKTIVGYSLLWFFGYLLTWMFKWLLIFIFTDYSITKEIAEKIEERAGVWHSSRIDVILDNITMLNLVPLSIILIGLLILVVIYFNRKGIQKALLFLAIACIPLLWLFATANHAEIHSWFTYRSLWVTVSGLFLTVVSLIRWSDIKFPFFAKKVNV